METEKLCPFRAFGPCPTEQCRFWIAGLEDCALVIAINRDEVLVEARLDAENWREAAEDAQHRASVYLEEIQECKERIAGMVPRAEYEAALAEARELDRVLQLREKELEDARAELEELHEQVDAMYTQEAIDLAEKEIDRLTELSRQQGRLLADARAELEALRAEGSEEAGGSEESTERESG